MVAVAASVCGFGGCGDRGGLKEARALTVELLLVGGFKGRLQMLMSIDAHALESLQAALTTGQPARGLGPTVTPLHAPPGVPNSAQGLYRTKLLYSRFLPKVYRRI